MEVKDKRVVVTGAASGIGKALCEAFKDAEAKSIVCVDMNLEGAKETAQDVNGLAVQANVGVEKDIINVCLLYTSPSPRDSDPSRMPSSA